MRFSSFYSIFLAALAFDATYAAEHRVVRSRHNGVAKRSSDAVDHHFSYDRSKLEKRAQFTYFVTGQGACGGFNVPSDFIVALSAQRWDGGSHCGETVTITINGITAQATIADECMGCDPEHLDFTEGLFAHFGGTESGGILEGSWSFGGSAPPPPSASPEPKPETTTSTPPPPPSTTEEPQPTSTYAPPTSTYVAPTTTSTPEPESSTFSSSESSSAPTSTADSSSAGPSSTAALYGDNDTIGWTLQAVIQLGNLVASARGAA